MNDNIGIETQLAGRCHALFAFQIQRDRALGAIAIVEQAGDAFLPATQPAHRVANAGRFHLDDVRALLRKHHGRERRGDHR